MKYLCVMYHDVYPDDHPGYENLGKSATSYHVSLQNFKKHIEIYRQQGLEFFSIEDISSLSSSSNGVLISFDDGWHGSLTCALDYLREQSLPAVYFVTTDFIGTKYFANKDTIRAARAKGFTIGAHGKTHRMLSSLSDDEILNELQTSKSVLEDILGESITTFSLPGGAGDRRVTKIAKELGFKMIFTSEIAINPTRKAYNNIARIGLMDKTSDEIVQRWAAYDLSKEWRKKTLLSIPKTILGMRNYSKLRRAILGETQENHHFKP